MAESTRSIPAAQTTDLWKRYPGCWSLRGADIIVKPGRLVGVLGENGSGKSTLFRILAGLTRPTKGTATVMGQPIGRKTRAVTAYLPEIDPFYAWMTVRETLGFVRAFYRDWDDARAEHYLAAMDLRDDAEVGALSRGQRARLKVVTAFGRRADLVLMDEPLSGIDQPSRIKVLQTLFGEGRDPTQTIMVSTHLVYEVEDYIEDVIFVKDGEIPLAGRLDDLREEHGKGLADLFTEVAV